jgi:hypothetical protein
VIVLRTVSMSAPEPDVRLLPPRYARVLLGVAMPHAYPGKASLHIGHRPMFAPRPPCKPAYPESMARLVRMDGTGHTTLAEWTLEDDAAFQDAVRAFGDQQALGYIGTVPEGPGKATHVRQLPRDADMVILRRPIAGG